MAPPGPQRPPQADLADALVHRHQHDVHHAHAADSQGKRADESQKHLEADGQAVDDGPELFPAKHLDGALIRRREVLALGNGGEDLFLRRLLKAGKDRGEDKNAGITGIPELRCGGIRNPAGFIVAGEVAAEIQFAVHHTDHRETHAADPDRLAHSGPAPEKLFTQAAAQEDQATPLQDVLRAEPPAIGRHLVAHLAVVGIDAADGGLHQAVAVREGEPAHRLKAHLLHQRRLRANKLHVLLLKDHGLARSLAARLLAGVTRPANDGAPAEGVEAIHQHEPEAVAVGNQQGDGHDPPHDAEHRQHAAQAIALQGFPGLVEDFSKHVKFSVLSFQFSVNNKTDSPAVNLRLSSLSFRRSMPSAKLQEPEGLGKKSRTNPGRLQSHNELSEG